MSVSYSPLSFQRRVRLLNQQSCSFIAADYPDYRADPGNSREGLSTLKSHGITTAITIKIADNPYRINLSRTISGGTIPLIEKVLFNTVMIKRQSAFLHQSVAHQCTLDSQTIGMEMPGDLIHIDDWNACLVTYSCILDEVKL